MVLIQLKNRMDVIIYSSTDGVNFGRETSHSNNQAIFSQSFLLKK